MIALVVAMACEARPLIDRYRLRADTGATGFRVYTGKDCALVVTGIGKLPTATACGYLYARLNPQRPLAWLNVGIGGHADWMPGKMVLAHKIRDAATGRAWYPPMLLDWTKDTAEVVTVERPEHLYPEAVVYEMEAAAFQAAAIRFSTMELVQALKVVSDNRIAPTDGLTPKIITGLVEAAMPDIEPVVSQLQSLAAELTAWTSDPPHYHALLERARFSVTRRHRLRGLLQQLSLLYPHQQDWSAELPSGDAGSVIEALEGRLAAAPPRVMGE